MDAPLPPFELFQPLLASTVDIHHEGTHFRFFVANPFDYIQAHHARGTLYEPASLAMIAKHFPPGGTFVDVGAYIGNHAIFAAMHLGATEVIAFEPGLEAHTILTVNKALNDLTRFEIRKEALSDAAGEAVLMTPAPLHLGRNHLVRTDTGQKTDPEQKKSTGPGQRVPVLRGDDALADRKVSFLKVDVEGHEMQALRGCNKVIAAQRPFIFAEIRDVFRSELDAWCIEQRYRIADSIRQYQGEENLLLRPTD
ncbi:MAG: FkbM family methyltransferase [Paracoccaceae bacterium]